MASKKKAAPSKTPLRGKHTDAEFLDAIKDLGNAFAVGGLVMKDLLALAGNMKAPKRERDLALRVLRNAWNGWRVAVRQHAVSELLRGVL